MIQIRKSNERGHADYGWLKTFHTFSFADYYDPAHTHFRQLRVINEDYVQPGQGFPTHSHQDMEIVTYVLEGTLEHKDSMGNGSQIRPGDVQRMSAGTGVTHSEYNASAAERVHLLQIWIFPEKKNLTPSYEQMHFEEKGKRNVLRLIASNHPKSSAVKIHQDAEIYDALLEKGKAITYKLHHKEGAWIQMIQGALRVNGQQLESGDGAAIETEPHIYLEALTDSEFLFFILR